METEEYLHNIVKNLPLDAGIYKYFDSEGTIIYVGKAKNIKNRVSSYFVNSSDKSMKTRKLVKEIRNIEYAVVNSEMDALLLENNLIKNLQPKYNILLKDGKSYPYICVTKEHFPRVLPTRQVDLETGTYFGPFGSIKAMNTLLELFRTLYTIRTCAFALTPKNIEQQKFKVCMEYHIKKCKAPCEKLQTEQEYQEDIKQIINILKGKIGAVKNYFKEKMLESAEKLAFEQAQMFKEKYEVLDKFQSRSMIVNPNISDLDVITISADEKFAFYNYMHIENGCITKIRTSEVKKKLDETENTILQHLILEYKSNTDNRIITNIEAEPETANLLNISTPKIGDLRKLVELSIKNVLTYKKEKMQREAEKRESGTERRVLQTMRLELNLPRTPKHIECFDNSNFQGTNAVSSMVCFKDGRAAKKEYRHFNVKTVEGANDFATMYEVVFRRYKRLKEEDLPMPDLVIVDGGKGQLSSAMQALKDLDLYGKMPLVGIAKRLEELYYPEDELPIHLNKKSEALLLIQRIRDEAHRFGITFHRDKRSKNSLTSKLEEIEGIGEKTYQKLLSHFKSMAKMLEADEQELIDLVGNHKTQIILKELKGK